MTRGSGTGDEGPRRATRWRAAGWTVVVLVLLFPAEVRAHGGAPKLAQVPAGPYLVSAWTQPDPPSVGRLDVSVAVTRPGTREAVSDAEVRVTGSHLTRPVTTSARAVFDVGWLFSLYQADLELPAPGRWRITLAVTGPAGSGGAAFELEVQPGTPVSWWLAGIAAVGAAFVAWRWGYRVVRQRAGWAARPERGESS